MATQDGAGGADQDPEKLVAEIERTREELAGTLDAIADKVSPKRAGARVAKKAAETVKDATESLKDTAGSVKEAAADTVAAVKEAAADTVAAAKESVPAAAVVPPAHTAGPATPTDLPDLTGLAPASGGGSRARIAGGVAALGLLLLLWRRRRRR